MNHSVSTDRPILFNGPRVRALLDGSKTQERRILEKDERYPCLTGDCTHETDDECAHALRELCPHGRPGDLLWVREPWWVNDGWTRSPGDAVLFRNYDGKTHTQITGDQRCDTMHGDPDDDALKATGWTLCPSPYIPRWASRLTLEITDVRVERLHDIRGRDIRAEGISDIDATDAYGYRKCSRQQLEGRFHTYWDNKYGTASWESNPLVWVLDFKVHRCNVDELLKAGAAR